MQPGGRVVIMNDSIVFAQQRSVKTLHGKTTAASQRA
jgi:hypothetical protein